MWTGVACSDNSLIAAMKALEAFNFGTQHVLVLGGIAFTGALSGRCYTLPPLFSSSAEGLGGVSACQQKKIYCIGEKNCTRTYSECSRCHSRHLRTHPMPRIISLSTYTYQVHTHTAVIRAATALTRQMTSRYYIFMNNHEWSTQ